MRLCNWSKNASCRPPALARLTIARLLLSVRRRIVQDDGREFFRVARTIAIQWRTSVVWSCGPPHGTPTMVHRAHIAPRSSRLTLIQVLVGLDSEDQRWACLVAHFAGLGISIAACASCSRPQPKIWLRPRVRLRLRKAGFYQNWQTCQMA
jgi:hypothetical protein